MFERVDTEIMSGHTLRRDTTERVRESKKGKDSWSMPVLFPGELG